MNAGSGSRDEPYDARMAPRFAAALSQHPVASHAVGEVAGEILEAFGGDDPDLVVCFASPHFVGAMDDLASALGNLLSPRALMGATAVSIIGGAREIEDGPALRCSRRRSQGRASRRCRWTSSTRTVPRRRHRLAGARPRAVDVAPARRSLQLPDRRLPAGARRLPRRPAHRAPGDRRRGLRRGGPGATGSCSTGRSPPPARSACSSTGSTCERSSRRGAGRWAART